jgi:predicted Zn finger-like uncharacterized protein
MQTRCPTCDTIYRVLPRQLAVAGGWVRCSLCHEVFHGYENRIHDDRPPPPDGNDDPTLPHFSAMPGAPATPAPVAPGEPFPPPLAEAWQTPPPRPSAARRLGGALLLLLALGGLLAQAGWHWRGTLLALPETAPWMQQLCTGLDCRLPPPRDLAQIELLSRDIRQHPARNGALLITATLVNRATFAQPWPLLEVSLSDLTGRSTALRRFTPAEYLEPAIAAASMPQGQPRTVVLEVRDPGVEAISFRFEFL